MQWTRPVLLGALSLVISASGAMAQQAEISVEDARAELNREQALYAQQQLEENAANQQAYDEKLKARAAEIERQKQEYEAAMARWREDAAACQAGDTSRCTGN